MKKNSFAPYLALGITFALFNVLAFVIPTEKTATFWIAYVFSVIAFLVQIPIWKTGFANKETLKSKFLGFPLISVGVTYLIIQLVAFALFMALPSIPKWIAIIVCAIILCFSALCLIAGNAGAEEINRIDAKQKTKRFYIDSLRVEVEMLINAEKDASTKMMLKKLAEKIRFSDPMSNDSLYDIEGEIDTKVKNLKNATDKKPLIEEIELLLVERNQKCKILK